VVQPSVVCECRLGHPPIASDDRDFALKPCTWGHRWEELDNPGYAGLKGVLKERSCYLCRLRFVDGTIYPEVQGETWKPGRGKKIGSHCIHCDICACKICRPILELNTPPRTRRGVAVMVWRIRPTVVLHAVVLFMILYRGAGCKSLLIFVPVFLSSICGFSSGHT
jgi:hypothetical protein